MQRRPAPVLLALALVFAAASANAACFADYKAKRDSPLRLHYGVIRLPDAACSAPAQAIRQRIARDGWTLLTVLGTFDAAGAEERRSDAGEFYLRY